MKFWVLRSKDKRLSKCEVDTDKDEIILKKTIHSPRYSSTDRDYMTTTVYYRHLLNGGNVVFYTRSESNYSSSLGGYLDNQGVREVDTNEIVSIVLNGCMGYEYVSPEARRLAESVPVQK